jgi:DNA-binding MarR family transcriptional regulator
MSKSTTTLDAIRDFVRLPKPEELETFDILFLSYLRLSGGKIEDTIGAIRRKLHATARTVRMSLARLERLGYVSVESRRGYSNVVTLLYPVGEQN